jgi:homoserine kinase type II
MAIYTKLSNEQITGILSQFDIKAKGTALELTGGSANSNYLVEDSRKSQRYVLTICDDKTQTEVASLAKILYHLEQYNFPATRLLRPTNNSDLISYQGKAILVKNYIEGKVVDNPNNEQLKNLGSILAQLNLVPITDYLCEGFPYGPTHFNELLDANIKHDYIDWLHDKKLKFSQELPTNLPKGLVHGDIFADNVVFSNSGNTVEAILDFEEVSYESLVWELGMAMVGTCRSDEMINFEKAKSLISGYQLIRPLQKIERESIQLAAEIAATSTSFWRFRNNHINHPELSSLTSHQEMQRVADQISMINNDEFLGKIFY